jgi:hypothetical protein
MGAVLLLLDNLARSLPGMLWKTVKDWLVGLPVLVAFCGVVVVVVVLAGPLLAVTGVPKTLTMPVSMVTVVRNADFIVVVSL